MCWHGEQSSSSIGAHGRIAARVLRALAAVLVGGPAKGVDLKERNVSHTEELFEHGLKCKVADEGVRLAFEERTDGEDSILIDFCSFASGRLAERTPYR